MKHRKLLCWAILMHNNRRYMLATPFESCNFNNV
uniref:Uncharacterized protein n=1 Tax=Setaria italica TaxID=4555 RepID=K3ZGV4_SETIT